jgi:drug/metabolite transporter (DMT)-like permease
MSLYYVAILLTIVSNIGYHLSTKKIPSTVNPFVALGVTYGTAFLLCVSLAPFFNGEFTWREQFQRVGTASYALGLCIVFLELGFVLAYRAGWNLSLAALYSNVAVGLLLLPIGIFLLGERLNTMQAFGVLCALVGIVLMSYSSYSHSSPP